MAISWRRNPVIFLESLWKNEYEIILRLKTGNVKGQKLITKIQTYGWSNLKEKNLCCEMKESLDKIKITKIFIDIFKFYSHL